MLGDPIALVGDLYVVVDFVYGPRVGAGATSGENVWHKGLGFQQPTHSTIEIVLCKKQHVTTVRARDHTEFVQMYSSPCFVMEKLRMVDDRGFTQRSPIVDGVSVVLCDLKLAIE